MITSVEQLEQEKRKLQESIDEINREITKNKFQITSEKLEPVLTIVKKFFKNFFLLIETGKDSYEIHKVDSYSPIRNEYGEAIFYYFYYIQFI